MKQDKVWRLIETPPYDAYMNLAIDEAMMLADSPPTLRFYKWDSPAITFGYPMRFREIVTNFAGLKLARRQTGGGIVIHGGDLTYSIVINQENSVLPKGLLESYRLIHECFIEAFSRLGIPAKLNFKPSESGRLCFGSPAIFDIMSSNRKIGGAAQYRRGERILQQGSVVSEVERELVLEGFSRVLGIEFTRGSLSTLEGDLARHLCGTKYATQKWNELR